MIKHWTREQLTDRLVAADVTQLTVGKTRGGLWKASGYTPDFPECRQTAFGFSEEEALKSLLIFVNGEQVK